MRHPTSSFRITVTSSGVFRQSKAFSVHIPTHLRLHSDDTSLHTIANQLVSGDFVTSTTGDRVTADVRLISAVERTAMRTAFNGAAHPSALGQPVALAERSCIACMGTLLRNGGSHITRALCILGIRV